MKRSSATQSSSSFLAFRLASTRALKKTPGPRPGAPGAGGPYLTLDPNELSLFSHAFLRFAKPVSVSGTIEKGKGLGPTFNGNDCAMCHAQPTAGGSSPGLDAPGGTASESAGRVWRSSMELPTRSHHSSPPTVPCWWRGLCASQMARRDGDVHALYTIAGRTDAKGCTLKQPDFAQQLADKNIVFRIPTPLFGLGLVENTPDATLRANLASTAAARSTLGIGGTFNIQPE